MNSTACLAAIMPVSLFFATETTVNLVVAPAYGSVAQRRKRARDQVVRSDTGGPHKGPVDHFGWTTKRTTGWTSKWTRCGPPTDHTENPH